ncbi:MAG: nuclear transport factor 2 family protein [Planctomycetota bacterium]
MAVAACVGTAALGFGVLESLEPVPLQDGTIVVQSRTDPSADALDQELRAFAQRYVETLAGGDDGAIATLYADEARFAWFTDGVRLYDSAADVTNSLGEIRGMGAALETTLRDVEVVPLAEGLAEIRALFRTRATIGDREAFAYAGAMTMVVERAGDGWVVVGGHSSTPSAPPRRTTER